MSKYSVIYIKTELGTDDMWKYVDKDKKQRTSKSRALEENIKRNDRTKVFSLNDMRRIKSSVCPEAT